MLKSHLRKTYEIVKHSITIGDDKDVKLHTFHKGVFQYFRVIDKILTVNGESEETKTKEFVYSSPSHEEYDKVLDRYCPRQMRRKFKTKELDYDSGVVNVCYEKNAPAIHGFRVCFKETHGGSQCQGHRNSCSGWSSKPGWTLPFRDDTDWRSGPCIYHWRLESLVPRCRFTEPDVQ